MEGCAPGEGAIGLEGHAEEGVGEGGEVVVVDPCVDEGGGEGEGADVGFDAGFGGPEGEGGPGGGVRRVVGHARVDVVLDMRLLCRIGERDADGHLVAPERGIDERHLRALEELADQRRVDAPFIRARRQLADEDGDVGQRGDLLRHDALEVAQLRAHAVAHGARDADQRRGLPPARVDDRDRAGHGGVGGVDGEGGGGAGGLRGGGGGGGARAQRQVAGARRGGGHECFVCIVRFCLGAGEGSWRERGKVFDCRGPANSGEEAAVGD